MKRVEVAGLMFDAITQRFARERIAQAIRSKASRKTSFIVVKPYVEFFIGAWQDPKLAQLLARADLSLADGVAVQWAASYLAGKHGLGQLLKSLLVDIQQSRWRSRIIPERGAGVDATHALLEDAERHGWRVGILGGPKDTTATQLALQYRYPKLTLAGVWSGYFDASASSNLVHTIAQQHLDILFCAMGFPLQEDFMFTHQRDGLARVLIGEGGTFDYDAMGGPLKRAPYWVRKIGLEWLWRLIMQPSRWRRQLAVPRFIAGIYRIGKKS